MSIGAQMRSAREARGLSVGTLSQRIRVQPRILSAIELDDSSAMPPRPFGRGFVRAYAEEVGLDPERTVRDYFAQFPSTATVTAGIPDAPVRDRSARTLGDPDLAPPSQWSGFGAAVLILALVVAAAVFLNRRNGAASEPNAVGTTGGAPVTAPAATEARPPAAEAPAAPVAQAPAPAPTVSDRPINLVLTAKAPCWVTATADGRRATFRTVQAGETETIQADREIVIRIGDAGAVSWTLNGKPVDSLGTPGQVRDLTITPSNLGTVR
jgi:cytoskeleton protein RodZ